MERRGFFAAIAGAMAAAFGFAPKPESIYEFATRVAPLAAIGGDSETMVLDARLRRVEIVSHSNGCTVEIDENGNIQMSAPGGIIAIKGDKILTSTDGVTWTEGRA